MEHLCQALQATVTIILMMTVSLTVYANELEDSIAKRIEKQLYEKNPCDDR